MTIKLSARQLRNQRRKEFAQELAWIAAFWFLGMAFVYSILRTI